MDRESALERLAGVYARALRLVDAGWDDDAIAREIEVDAASVPLLLEIGRRKLARLMTEHQ